MKKMAFVILLIVLSTSLFTQVRNVDRPIKGTWDFGMKKLWETDSAGKEMIGVVQNIRSAKDGRIYVADEKNCRIDIYSKDGKFISSFGTKGEGPGEIKNYQSGEQLFVLDNTVIFADRSKVHYFARDGSYNRSIIYPTRMKPRVFVSHDRFISAPAYARLTGDKSAEIKLFDLESQSEKIIARFRPFDKAMASQQSGGSQYTVGIIIGNITPLMFVQYRDGKIYYGMSNSYHIRVVDLNGKQVVDFSIEKRERKPVSKAYKEDLKKGLGDIPADMLKRILDGLPEKASFFQGIEVDRNGLIYVFVSDPERDSASAVDIFSPDGKYIYAAEFKVAEEESIQVVYFKDELLVLGIEDEEGNQKVAKYAINLPGAKY